jgi:hypothetical protein
MREHWRANGPPVNITAVAIAMALGVDLIGEKGPAALTMPPVRASIAELARLKPVSSGHDTRAASRMIAERWEEAGNGE